MTVVFCDLVGSTRLSLELDAEDFASAVRTYRDACVRVVRHWGGCVSRYIGDGVLIYFGYPRASADDALRGVAAAWELVHTIQSSNFQTQFPDAVLCQSSKLGSACIRGWQSSGTLWAQTVAISSVDAEFELRRGLYKLHLLRGELRTADNIADQLLVAARGIVDHDRRDGLLLVALRSKALPAFYGASYREARSLLTEMLSLHDPQKHRDHAFLYGTEPVALALSYLAWMDVIDGQTTLARQRVSDALMRAQAEGHVFSICYALCFAASCAQLSGDVDAAAAYADDAFGLANEFNFQYWLAWAQAIQGWVKGLREPPDGIALIQRARSGYLATGSSLAAPYLEALTCNVARSTGLKDFTSQQATLKDHAKVTGVWFWEAALDARPLLQS